MTIRHQNPSFLAYYDALTDVEYRKDPVEWEEASCFLPQFSPRRVIVRLGDSGKLDIIGNHDVFMLAKTRVFDNDAFATVPVYLAGLEKLTPQEGLTDIAVRSRTLKEQVSIFQSLNFSLKLSGYPELAEHLGIPAELIEAIISVSTDKALSREVEQGTMSLAEAHQQILDNHAMTHLLLKAACF